MLALLLISASVAMVTAVIVWSVSGFWWAFGAYAVVGAVILLLLAALQAYPARKKDATGEFVKSEAAG